MVIRSSHRGGGRFVSLAAVLVMAAGVGGFVGYQRWSTWSFQENAARAESRQQAAEVEKCQSRLKKLHAAWSRYRGDHDGAEPPSFAALIPRYIKEPGLLTCPTADRWLKQRKAVTAGELEYKEKKYVVTYGFKWLAAGYAISLKHQGEAAPLISCPVHEEVLYRAAYGKAPALGELDEENKKKLVPTVAQSSVLLVRRNGELGTRATEAH